MEKLKLIETNLMKSLQMTEWVIRREKRQRDLIVRIPPPPPPAQPLLPQHAPASHVPSP